MSLRVLCERIRAAPRAVFPHSGVLPQTCPIYAHWRVNLRARCKRHKTQLAADARGDSEEIARKARQKLAPTGRIEILSAYRVGAARAEYGTVPSRCVKPYAGRLGRVSSARQHAA